MQLFFVFVVVFALFCSVCTAEKLEYHTFQPPFSEIDAAGTRQVGLHWRTSGTTVVNNNFVRITPDRQSKKGAIWSKKSLGVPSFSAVLKFRISGQGKNFFGDGLAMWIVQQGYYSEGNLHGFQEKFVGIGIIFDTFKNTEHLAAHRDVTVLINDGEKTWEMMTEDVKGCNMNVRYHADRADFSVNDASRAKVVLDEIRGLQLYIDAKNSGEWVECVSIKDLGLPKDWIKKSYLGLTATTGQLADNHDVISLASYSDFDVMEVTEAEKDNKKLFETLPTALPEARLTRLENAINDMMIKNSDFDHHVEHEFASVNDHIDNLINKVKTREAQAETRIDNLEELVKKEVEGTMEARLSSLENQMKSVMERRINSLEANLDRKITTKIGSVSSGSTSSLSTEDVEKMIANNLPSIPTGGNGCDCSNLPLIISVVLNALIAAYVYYKIYVAKKKYSFD